MTSKELSQKNFSESILLLSRIFLILSPLSLFFGVLIVNLNLRQYGFEDFALPLAKSFAVGFTFIFIHIFFFLVLSRNSEEWKSFYSVLKYFLNFAANLLAFFSGFILLLSFDILPAEETLISIASYFFYLVVFISMLLFSEFDEGLKSFNKIYLGIIVFALIGLTFVMVKSFYEHERLFTVFCYFGFLSLVFLIFHSVKNFLFHIKHNFVQRNQEKISVIVSLFVCLLLTLVFYYSKFVYPNFQSALGGGEPNKNISLTLKETNKAEITGQIVHVKSNLYFVKGADKNIRIINIDDVEMININPVK